MRPRTALNGPDTRPGPVSLAPRLSLERACLPTGWTADVSNGSAFAVTLRLDGNRALAPRPGRGLWAVESCLTAQVAAGRGPHGLVCDLSARGTGPAGAPGPTALPVGAAAGVLSAVFLQGHRPSGSRGDHRGRGLRSQTQAVRAPWESTSGHGARGVRVPKDETSEISRPG